MPLRLRFLRANHPKFLPFQDKSIFAIWTKYYIVQWTFLHHLFEIFLLLVFLFQVTIPIVQYHALFRQMFFDLFYPEYDEDQPISNFTAVSAFYADLFSTASELIDESLMEIQTVPDHDIIHLDVVWNNGSQSTLVTDSLTIDLFYHSQVIIPTIEFLTYSNDVRIGGCTHWIISIEMSCEQDQNTFIITPTTTREQCVFQDSPPIYFTIIHFLFVLLFLTSVDVIYLFAYGISQWKRHKVWCSLESDYVSLSTAEQFHLSFGYWYLIHFVSTISLFLSSIFLLNDIQEITQLPSQMAIKIFCLASFFSIFRMNKWFKYFIPFYQLILIVKRAFFYLVNMYTAIAPLVSAFIIVGVFVFGLTGPYYTFGNIQYLVQRMITSGMGDSIDDFFIVSSNGDELNFILGFLYVGCITAGTMWVIFTSCIATIQLVHENLVHEYHEEFKFKDE